MKIRDMGMTNKSESKPKETISGIKPVNRFPEDESILIHGANWMPQPYKTQPVHDSLKHVMHNRNHIAPGAGRHK